MNDIMYDSRFEDAARWVVREQDGRTSTLQRRLALGYARACRMMEQMEVLGIVGPRDENGQRQVLVQSIEVLENILEMKP